MRKLLTFIFILSVLVIACNAPASAPVIENTVSPADTIQFTAAPTFTPEVQSAIQATENIPTSTPAAVISGPLNVIQFKANGTSADITDSVAAGTSKTYTLNAMKGQIMSISVLPQVPDGDWGYLSIRINGANGSALCPQAPDTECLYWRGVLPATQDYSITLTPNGTVPQFVLRVAINPPGKDVQYFQYSNPATGVSLTYSDLFAPSLPVYGNYKINPELTLHLIDSKTYEKTNLSEAYIFVSSSSDPQIVATCTEPNQNGGGSEELAGNQVINGLNFVHTSSEGAGAGNYYEQEVYRMVNNNICHEVIFFIHSNNAGNYVPGTVTEFDRDALIQKFFNVFSTFAIK